MTNYTRRRLLNLLAIPLAGIMGLSACSTTNETKYAPEAEGITDMALIYHTNTDRPDWNASELTPFIFREKDNKIEWLFDGFLFLEIRGTRDDNGLPYDYGTASTHELKEYNLASTRKTEWEKLIQLTFADKRGPNALEEVLDSLAQTGQVPPYKRQVMISIPNPTWAQADWGSIDKKDLNFSSNEDRFEAVKWYMDEVEKEWKKHNYKHIQLAGYYWLNESLVVGYGDDNLLKLVQPEIEKRGYDFSWIPYNGAGLVDRWQEFKFTQAYQQPNYFFDEEPDIEKMYRALEMANKHNMAMEFEFDERVFDTDQFYENFFTYVDEFTKAGVFESKPVAYYHGTAGVLRVSQSKDPKYRKIYDTLCDILVSRTGKFTQIKQ